MYVLFFIHDDAEALSRQRIQLYNGKKYYPWFGIFLMRSFCIFQFSIPNFQCQLVPLAGIIRLRASRFG